MNLYCAKTMLQQKDENPAQCPCKCSVLNLGHALKTSNFAMVTVPGTRP